MIHYFAYSIAKLLLSCYFTFISSIFWIWNFFQPRRIVEQASNQLLLISAGESAAMIRRGDISSVQLVEAYIERIKQVNEQINAVVDDNFIMARNMAQNIDNYLSVLDKNTEEYKNLAHTKPLFGVPFTVKDNTYCKGFVCTAGVVARKHNERPSQEDSEAVKKLKEAGAILLGITNVPELALWWETSNTVYGTTKNPYDTRRTPGGSSGGEAAVIAAAGSVIGLGNDVCGSLRIPSIFCGIFGLKPGPGIIPATGIIPRVHGGYLAQMSTVGPMTRYASDLALMLRILTGENIARNRLKLDHEVDFKNVRVFYMEEIKTLVSEDLCLEMRQAVRKTAKYFEKKYDIYTHRLDLLLMQRAFEMFVTSVNESDHDKITEAMSNFAYDVNCFAELVKYPFGWSDHTLPAIITGMRSKLPKQSEATNKFIDSKRDQLRREIIDLLNDNGILIFPGWPTIAPFHYQPLFSAMNVVYTAIWNALALPVLACPVGLNADGLPIGIQIVCSPNSERLLIAAAQDLEEGFGGWTQPENQAWGTPPPFLRRFVPHYN